MSRAPIRLLGIAIVMALAFSAAPAPAVAGAPNYDCFFAGSTIRLAYDEWRGVLIVREPGRGATRVPFPQTTVPLRARIRGEAWRITINVPNAPVAITVKRGHHDVLHGRCVVVEGWLILRQTKPLVLRAKPSPSARSVLALAPASYVWQCQIDGVPGWTPVTVFPTIETEIDGWIKATPLPRDPRQTSLPGTCGTVHSP